MTTVTHALARRLDRIHRAAGPLEAALASLDEYVSTRAAFDRLEALPEQLPHDHAPRAVEAALAVELGAERPTDLERVHDVARKAAADAAAAALVSDAVARRRAALADQLDGIVRTRAAEVAAHLNGQLRAVLTEAADVLAALDGIADADDVLAADDPDVRAAWQRWPQLEAAYEGIRNAQAVLWRLLDNSGRNMRDIVSAFIARPEAADPEYVARRGQQRIETATGERDPRPAPWPALWERDALRWLIAHPEAEAWVPSMAQLDAAEERLRTTTRELIHERTRRAVSR